MSEIDREKVVTSLHLLYLGMEGRNKKWNIYRGKGEKGEKRGAFPW